MALRVKKPMPASLSEITLKVGAKTPIVKIQKDLTTILDRLGCPGCMSGLDRIIINNERLRGGR